MKQVDKIRSTKEIQNVLSSKNRLHSNALTLFFSQNARHKKVRFVFIVSKKISLKAVIRNKVRRQIKAMINEINLTMNFIDVVVIAKQNFLNNTYQQNLKILSKLLNKIVGGS